MSRLVIYSSGIVNRTIELTGQNIRIGRAQGNEVVLFDPGQVVSRFHAELRYEDGRYILLDLNSANGTWVLDHRIQRVVFDTGTVAEIGDYRLVLEADTEATTALPTSRLDLESRQASASKPASGTFVISAAPPDVAPTPVLPPAISAGPPGDLVEAQKEYQRALGEAAFERANTFDAMSRTEDAIAHYERAVQLLPPDDPNGKVARARLDMLRAPFIKQPSR